MLHRLAGDQRIEIANLRDFGVTEKKLEDFLASHLGEVFSEEHLMLVAQERPFQEEADLLALDRDGILYIFELKRWESRQENILQVLRYGQRFGQYGYKELEGLAQRRGLTGQSLREAHRAYFELDTPLKEERFNSDQVFVLVTNGTDELSINAVNYWSLKGVKIVCVPYSVYRIGGDGPYIHIHTYNPTGAVTAERESRYFVVNTNKTYMPDAWKDMLSVDSETGEATESGKAAAYYSRKYPIGNIPKRSTVFLYHTGVGVIAKGISASRRQKADFRGDQDEEYFVPLKFDWAIRADQWDDLAPKAREINRRLNTGHRFRQTVFAIGQEMADAIEDIARNKRKEAKK